MEKSIVFLRDFPLYMMWVFVSFLKLSMHYLCSVQFVFYLWYSVGILFSRHAYLVFCMLLYLYGYLFPWFVDIFFYTMLMIYCMPFTQAISSSSLLMVQTFVIFFMVCSTCRMFLVYGLKKSCSEFFFGLVPILSLLILFDSLYW